MNFYRKFIKNFSAIAGLIIELIKKEVVFYFRDEYKKAFKELKRLITLALVLRIFDPEKEVVVKTNALNKVIGGCLK
jgi:hypothetical protein